MDTIQATVNPRLLTKASRLFTGTLEGRIIEILQNARRAGATEVKITNDDGCVTVHDNGNGIEDFSRLLDLGGSGWDESLEDSEDPAGVGLFCLAPRQVTVRSNGRMAVIFPGAWAGAPVAVTQDPDPMQGTSLQFEDSQWLHTVVESLAVFSGLKVVLDGIVCASESFISGNATGYPELGCRIEVRESSDLQGQHRALQGGYRSNSVLVNFHGQVVAFSYHPVSHLDLVYLVDLTGEPTGIRLMLPARTRVIENDALNQLKASIELEAFRYLQRRGHHQLGYKEYLRARELGIELPEADPAYEVGLLRNSFGEPIQVSMPDRFPLAQCYRLNPNCESDTHEANTHLLAATGALDVHKLIEAFKHDVLSKPVGGACETHDHLVFDCPLVSARRPSRPSTGEYRRGRM